MTFIVFYNFSQNPVNQRFLLINLVASAPASTAVTIPFYVFWQEYEQKRGSRRDPGGDSSPIPGGTRRHAERCRCLWGAKAGRGGRHGGNERSYGNDGFYRTSLQNTQCTAPGKPSSVPAVHQGLLLRGPATAGIETERSGPRTSEMWIFKKKISPSW